MIRLFSAAILCATLSTLLVTPTAHAEGLANPHTGIPHSERKRYWGHSGYLPHPDPFYRQIREYPRLHDYFARQQGEQMKEVREQSHAHYSEATHGYYVPYRYAEGYEGVHATNGDWKYYSPSKFGYPPYYAGPYYTGRPEGSWR